MSTSQAQVVQVNSADPSSAQQGTVDLEVEIKGSGFDNSAAVDFFVTGTTNPGGIIVKKVKVRGPKKIIVTIDVDSLADVDDFDIVVQLSRGRNGKGTTLFRVLKKGSSGLNTTTVTFRDSGADGLQSDCQDIDPPVVCPYVHKQQIVSASIAKGTYLRLNKGNQLAMRTLFLDFRDCVSGVTDHVCKPPFQDPPNPDDRSFGNSVAKLIMQGSDVDLQALGIGEDSSLLRLSLLFDLSLVGGGSWHLGFDVDGFGICPGGTDIDVTRSSADTWEIEATSDDVGCLVKLDGSAFGETPSGLYRMPFKMTVKKQD